MHATSLTPRNARTGLRAGPSHLARSKRTGQTESALARLSSLQPLRMILITLRNWRHSSKTLAAPSPAFGPTGRRAV